MKRLLIFAFALACVVGSFATSSRADEPTKLNVWPAKAPGDLGPAKQEQWTKMKVTNVTVPTLTIFRPEKSKNTGVAIIVCPGGGYTNLMMDYEGEDVAKWLTTQGITGIVLKYRVPAPQGTPRYLPALQDAQRSMSIVRAKAGEWKIDPKRIGMLGFSAGGHLVVATATNFDKRAYEAIDDIDKQNTRPDFVVSIYPGGVIKRNSDQLSEEIHVTSNTPPTFIAQATDDRLSENAVFLYLALKRANVPVELHLYSTGGHGFGMKPSDKPCATWPQRMIEWMHVQGVLKKDSSQQANARQQ